MIGRLGLLATCAWLALVPGETAIAQEAPEIGAGDIVVTARRREESILKVPVVANVLDAASIERDQIVDISGLSTKVPGLIVSDSVNTIGTQISLRGVGTSALDAGIDQSVSLNIDGQQFSQGLTFKSGLFDLAQAEVLKGPQALFFGKNSPGGVISLTTADPSDEVEVIGRAAYEFEANETMLEAILSGPVTDTLGLRLAGSWADREGYFRNTAGATAIPALGGLAPHKRSDGNEGWIVRGTAVWEPTDQFKARLKVNLTRDKSNNPNPMQNYSCLSGTGPSVVGIPFIGGTHPCKLDRETETADLNPATYPGVPNNGRPFLDMKQRFGVLDLSYAFASDINATSITTYYKNTTEGMINGTFSGAGTAIYADNDFSRRDFTQEIRIESDYGERPLNWMIGGFLQDAKMKNDIIIGVNTVLQFPTTPVGVLAAGTHDVDIASQSLFGQLRWKPADVLEIAGGVRWTHEKRSNNPTTLDAFGAVAGVPGTFYDVDAPDISSKRWSPELTITYTPTDDLTFFGALKQGYKSGSYQITTPNPIGVDQSFGDEKVQGGEVGVKARVLDRSLSLNAAFYYYRFSGLQVGVSQPAADTGVPITRTLNAGKARTYGIDFDATYRPPSLEGLSVNLAVNWNDAKYLELDGVPCYGGQTIGMGCNQVFDPTATSPLLPGQMGLYTARSATGLPLERAPEWQVIGGADYQTSVTEKLDMLFGASVQHSSSWMTPIGDRPDFRQRSYTKLNAYLTVKDNKDAWEVSLIGNNLTDELTCAYAANSDFLNTTLLTSFAGVTGAATNPTGKVDEAACIVNPGRQVWLRLTLRPMGLFR